MSVPEVYIPKTRAEFEGWIELHPKGYVINRLSGNRSKIHYGKCGHFKDSRKHADLTHKHRKFCSVSREALESEWARRGEPEPERCGSCEA